MLIYVWKNTVVDTGSIEQIWDDGKSDDKCFYKLRGDESEYYSDIPWRDLAELVQGAPFVELRDGLLVARDKIASIKEGAEGRSTIVYTVDSNSYEIDLPYDTVKKLIGARVVATPAALELHEQENNGGNV